MTNWPDWWSWDIQMTYHVLDRMIDRSFSETDLRQMLDDATNLQPNHEPGLWTITTQYAGEPWKIIVEPIDASRIIKVIAAYPVN